MAYMTLRELLEKVKAGTWDDYDPHAPGTADFSKDILGKYSALDMANDAYSWSLDAAQALHRGVLPGWRWGASEDEFGIHVFWVQSPDITHPASINRPCGRNENPARAWLIAILEALLAEAIE